MVTKKMYLFARARRLTAVFDSGGVIQDILLWLGLLCASLIFDIRAMTN